jgi:hypothetical protein
MTMRETLVRKTHKRLRRLFVLAATTGLLWGCAQQQPGGYVPAAGGDSPVQVHVGGFFAAGAVVH